MITDSNMIIEARTEKYLSLFFFVAMAAVGGIRLYYCFLLPVNTGDAVRHVCWGLIVNQHGYDAITHNLLHWEQNLGFVSWAKLPYNYPIFSLLFDQLCAMIYPSIFTYKAILTLIELVNSYIIGKLTNSRLLALAYWGGPFSIWWVSREGQFEPLQSFFVLIAIWLLNTDRYRNVSWAFLAVAVQTKLTAIFIIPYFIYREANLRNLRERFIYFSCAMIPSVLLMHVANPMRLLFNSFALKYNPYYWNFFQSDYFAWNPPVLVLLNQVSSYFIIAMTIIYIYNYFNKAWFDIFPLLSFIIFLKSITNAQFWYVNSIPPLIMTISKPKWRRLFLLLLPFLDLRSLLEMVLGPFGNIVSESYYKAFTDGVMTNLNVLF